MERRDVTGCVERGRDDQPPRHERYPPRSSPRNSRPGIKHVSAKGCPLLHWDFSGNRSRFRGSAQFSGAL